VNTVQLGRVAPVDPLAPRVPERTIGVSIAGHQQARVAPRTPAEPPPAARPGSGFEAVQPQDEVDEPAWPATARVAAPGMPAPATGAPRALEIGQVRCQVCGHPVGADRRFCRCGASLIPRAAAAAGAPAPRRLPWYRRIGDLVGGGRDFRRSMRGANRGLRATYNVGMSIRAQFVRVSVLLGTVGIGLSQLGPWGGDVRSQLRGRIDRLLPHSYVDVKVDQTATDPATRALPGFDVAFAVDGDPGRAWAAPWRPAGDSGQPCRRAGGAPALVLTFRQPATINRVTIAAGLAEGNNERPQQARPRQVDLLFSDGTCTVFDLADSPGGQHVDVNAAKVTNVRVVIVDAYPPRDAGGAPLVSLSEVGFQQRK
jgi:hypothetical protein